MYTGLSSRLPVGAVRNKSVFKRLPYDLSAVNTASTRPAMLFGPFRAATAWTAGTIYGFDTNTSSLTGSNMLVDFKSSGTTRFSVSPGGSVVISGQATISASSGFLSIASDVFLSRKGTANWQQGVADAAAPVAQTSSVQSVVDGTSNTAGVTRTYAGSQSTGNQVGGGHAFQTSPAGSSGTAQNALVTAFTINGDGTSTFAYNQYGALGTAAGVVISLPRSYSAVYNG